MVASKVQILQFQRHLAAGDFSRAAALGRSLGYSDEQISRYTGSLSLGISTDQARSFLTASPAPAAIPIPATIPVPAPVPAAIPIPATIPATIPAVPVADTAAVRVRTAVENFRRLIFQRKFSQAALLGRSLGYSDSLIAQFVAGMHIGISEKQAFSFLQSEASGAQATAALLAGRAAVARRQETGSARREHGSQDKTIMMFAAIAALALLS